MANVLSIRGLLLLIGLIVFGQVTFFAFINLDDHTHLVNNPFVNSPGWQNLKSLWGSQFFEMYIPLTYTWWSLLAGLSTWVSGEVGSAGMLPQIFHGANLILHLLNALLVFSLIRKAIEGSEWGAFFGAAVFLLHPLQVESVAWVSAAKDSFSAFWFLLAFHQFLIFAKSHLKALKRPLKLSHLWQRHYFLGLGFLALSLLAKPQGVILCLLLPLYLHFFWQISLKKKAAWKILWGPILLSALATWITMGIQRSSELQFLTPWYWRPWVALDAWAFYFWKILWPLGLGPDYGRSPKFVLEQFWFPYTSLVFLVLLLGVWWKGAWARGPLAWIGIGYLPVLGLIPFHYQDFSTVADRYSYLSLIGLGFLLARLYEHLPLGPRVRNAGFGFLVGVLALLCARQASVWHNSESLFTHTRKVNPQSWMSLYTLAQHHITNNNMALGEKFLNEALRVRPDYLKAQIALGTLKILRAQYKEGRDYFSRLIEQVKPAANSSLKSDATLYFSLAFCQEQLGQKQLALKNYKRSVDINWTDPDAQYHFARFLWSHGNVPGAYKHSRIAHTLVPGQKTFAQLYIKSKAAYHRQTRPSTQ